MDLRIVVLVGWCLFVGRVWSQKAVNGTVTIPNNDVCANTLIGTDYTGKLTVTGSGARCRHWSPIANQIPVQNADSTFPDRTVLEASNYCRNPYQFGTFNSPGFPTYRQQPFCFVGTTGNAEELCEIPLCGVPDEREVCNHRLRSPPSGVTLKTCSCSVNAIASNINKHFLTVDYLYKVLPSANCDLKAGLDILRVNKDQSANCENGEVFNVTENAAVYVQNVKAYFSGQLTNALYEYKISYAGYKSVSIKQCDNPEWTFSALWQTVVSEQRNDFWKIHIEFVEPTPTVHPSTPASTGTDSVSSTGTTGTVVSSTNIVSSTSVSIPSSVQSSTGGTDSSSVTSASTDSSTPVQSSTGTVASTLVSSQSASSSGNTIQPSSSSGDQSSSVQPSSSAGSQTAQPSSSGVTGTVQPSSSGVTGTVQPSSSGVTGTVQPSSSGVTGTVQPSSSGVTGTIQPSSSGATGTAQPSSSETPPLSTTGGTAQSTTGTVASSITSPQSSATSIQTSGTGSVDSSTSGGGTDHSSGAQSSNSVRTTGTEAQNTGTGINPTATRTSSTGTGISATGTPSSSTPGVTTTPKMEINDQEWKLAVGLGVAMCILFILGILLACFIVHVCCCKERAKRRRELYYAAQLQAEKDSPQGNGVLPTITVTSVPDGKPLEIITSNEDGQSLSSANPNDVEIEIPKDDIDEPGYATIRKPDADTPSLTSDADPAYATIQRGEPPPVPPKMDEMDETVTAAVVTNGVGSKTASRRGSESDSIKLAAHESSHHPDVLLANKHVTIGDEKHVRIAANGRVKEIPRPLVVPPSDSERKKGGKPRAYSSLPRVRHAENPTVHSYSPSYTVVTPHRQRQFATNTSLRYVSSPPRSPVFLVRGQGGPVVAGGQNIPMRGLVLRPPTPARIPGRYRKRGHPGHSSMRSSRSAEFGDL